MRTLPPLPGTDADLIVEIDLVTARITVTGEFDRAGAHLLDDATATLASTVHRSWALDVSAIGFCDAGGLRAVAAAAEVARRRGGQLAVVGAGRCLRRLLAIVGLGGLLADAGRPVDPSLVRLPPAGRDGDAVVGSAAPVGRPAFPQPGPGRRPAVVPLRPRAGGPANSCRSLERPAGPVPVGLRPRVAGH